MQRDTTSSAVDDLLRGACPCTATDRDQAGEFSAASPDDAPEEAMPIAESVARAASNSLTSLVSAPAGLAARGAHRATRGGRASGAMDQSDDPPDDHAGDPNVVLSLETPPQLSASSSPNKRRASHLSSVPPPGHQPSLQQGQAEDTFLRSLSVVMLRRVLGFFGEQPDSRLRKADLIARVEAHRPEAVAAALAALTAPPDALPLPPPDMFAQLSQLEAIPSPAASAAPAVKKSRRGGPRVGAGRKKKAAAAFPSPASTLPPLTDVIRMSTPAAAAVRSTPSSAVSARMQLTNSSSTSSPGGSTSVFVSPPALLLDASPAEQPELAALDMDFSATASSDGLDLLQ